MRNQKDRLPSVTVAWAIVATGLLFASATVWVIIKVDWFELGFANAALWRLASRGLTALATLWVLASLYWAIHCHELRSRVRERDEAKRLGLKDVSDSNKASEAIRR